MHLNYSYLTGDQPIITTQVSAQLLIPRTDNPEIQIEEVSNPKALLMCFWIVGDAVKVLLKVKLGL